MKYILLFVSLFFAILNSWGSHIVGGEFEIFKNPRGLAYTIQLNVYFDEESALSGLLESDRTIICGIYEKNTNLLVQTVPLTLQSANFIVNAAGGCIDPNDLRFRNKFYKTAEFFPNNLTSPNGYYIVWEQCCRNSNIDNLTLGDSQSLTFYAEFPSTNIINNTPDFPEMQNRSLCRGQLNTFDYSGRDPDGDSLIYYLTSPIDKSIYSPGNSADGGFYQYSAPYNSVIWNSGYSSTNQITGSVNLAIDRHSGVMTVNPSSLGLFVWGVMVEEYRNGVLLGRVKREFQIKVVDCPLNNAPDIRFRNTTLSSGDTIPIRLKPSPAQCYPISLADIDVALFNKTETITISKVLSSFPSSIISIPSSSTLTPAQPESTVNMCFDPCLVFQDGIERFEPIKIIINDNSCPTKYDTLTFILHLLPTDNHKPTITIDPSGNTKSIRVDSLLRFTVRASDEDPTDPLSITLYGSDGTRNFSFNNVRDSFLTASSVFTYMPSCEELKKGSFTVYFVVDDGNCDLNSKDTIYQTIVLDDNINLFNQVVVPNLLTLNNDGKNDVLYIPNLPPDNCSVFFKNFSVYNRWGAVIYSTGNRNFVWDPNGLSEGIYFYALDLNEKQQKGWVQIIGYK